MKKSLFVLSFSLLVSCFLSAQEVSYDKIHYPVIKKLKTIDISQLDDDYLPTIEYLEAPKVSGNTYKRYLAELKENLKTTHPRNNEPFVQTRGDADPPEIDTSFRVGGIQPGRPLDNHLAMSGDNVVSAVNSFISIQTKEGAFVKNYSLANFAMGLGVNAGLFDPRLIYDPQMDRYVAIFLSGYDSDESNIVVTFSDTNDPEGDWHAYVLPGNPNNDNTWTDYPMVTVTDTDIVLTINLLRDGESWQLGFEKTLIWQMDKSKGYAGEDLDNTVLWSDVNFGNASIRNLCPVGHASDVLPDKTYFVSDRNFDIENDTFLLVQLTGGVNDADAELIVDFVVSDFPYGVPPNAMQEEHELQTNDARVLEAFIIEDEIQFVGNTRNLTNNQCGIFHGILTDLEGTPAIHLEHIIGEDYEIGYPGITWMGDNESERDAIITFDHTGVTKYAGISAMYYNLEDGYSDIITIVDGAAPCTMNNSGTLDRWGDYMGTQRDFANPDEMWVSGFSTLPNGNNHPWIAHLSKPQPFSSTDEKDEKIISNVFPNPVADRVSVEFTIPQNAKNVSAILLNMEGKQIDKLIDTSPHKKGLSRFSFDVSTLQAGTYFVEILIDNQQVVTKKIIVQ